MKFGKRPHGSARPTSPFGLGVILWSVSLLTVGASPAQAQTYRCNAGGTVVLSDRPCAASSRIGGYGPLTPDRPIAGYGYKAGADKAEPHVKYLGTECASISEGMRTGPARGVRGDVIQELRAEYQRKCTQEDADARRLVLQDQAQEQSQRQAHKEAALNARAQQAQQADRCAGMRDVISVRRRQENSLNPKEVEALRSLENTFNAQCLVR